MKDMTESKVYILLIQDNQNNNRADTPAHSTL